MVSANHLLHSLDHPRRNPTLDRLDVSKDYLSKVLLYRDSASENTLSAATASDGRMHTEATAKADCAPIPGIPRPSFKSEKIAGDSNETQKWVSRYLAVGETAMDWAVVTAGQSGWFERNR